MTTHRTVLHVTQERIDRYGRANGDAERLHYDAGYARARGFRGTIAHGTMLSAGLVDLALRQYGERFLAGGRLSFKWTSPVCAGDVQESTIDAQGRIEAVNASLADRPATLKGQASPGEPT